MLRVLLAAATLWTGCRSCSYVEVPARNSHGVDGSQYVIGRTVEVGFDGSKTLFFTDSFLQARVNPRGGWGPLGFVGMETVLPNGTVFTIDEGMNEAGLTISAQTLRESEYEALEPSGVLDAPIKTVLPFMLGSCHNVSQGLEWLEAHRVVGRTGGGGLHWALADAAGRSVVVEYLKGKRVIYENTPRVMTNDPPLDWHWRNLNTYVNLNPAFPHQNDFLALDTAVGSVPRAVGHGWNLFGLPGDGSPPSRFVQLFYQRGYSLKTSPPASLEDAMVLVTGLLNKVFIPMGTFAADTHIPGDMPEYTPYAVMKIPSARQLLYRGYKSMRWKRIQLKHIDFDVDPSDAPAWPVEDGTLDIEDVVRAEEAAV